MDPKSVDMSSDHILNIMSQEQEFNIPINSMSQEPIKRKPIESLFESKRDYMEICVPLYRAAITSDWEAAKLILGKRPELVRFAITPNGDTTLHIAVEAKGTKQGEIFVENLVERMEIEDLEIENNGGDLAYMIAAAKGNVDMFKVIVNKHKDLLRRFPDKTLVALDTSTVNEHHDMTLHFYNVLESTALWFWGKVEWCFFFINCVYGDLFDIALKVLEDHPIIGTSFRTCFVSLDILARKPDTLNRTETDTYTIWRISDTISAFSHVKKNSPEKALKLVQSLLKLYPISSDQHDILGNLDMNFNDKKIKKTDMNPRGLLFTAAEMGNTRFVIEVIRMFPKIIIETKDDGTGIFHIAIMRRYKGIYSLLYETSSHMDILARWEDDKNNNILHLLGMTSNDTAQQTLSGSLLIMQRELLWYKEVEKMMPPVCINSKNHDSKTPFELFSENNKELFSKGLKWTRDCTVVATLIITVAFAVAFTVPGGYNQETGIPIFDHDTSFLVFIIADAFSLFTSSTSLLVFLSILISPYGQRDFLYAMPGKLMMGLVALFMSVSAIMVTFAASFFVIYQNTFKWVPILISVFAATPIIIFAALQYSFFIDVFCCMYDSRYLFNTRRRILYNKNISL